MAANRNVTIEDIKKFWSEFIYDDTKIASSRPGTKEFFQELSSIRAGRLPYLSRLVNFNGYEGKQVLEVGCRIGLDLMQFARGGAQVTGVELADEILEPARENFSVNNLKGDFYVMDGEKLEFEDSSFDLVYAYGVVPYTADPQQMISEIHRVLRPGGIAIVMVYNRYSWLVALSKLTGKNLTHEEAPGFKLYARKQFYDMFANFSEIEVTPERFPEKTGLHTSLFSKFFYLVVVNTFNLLPKSWIKPIGAHLIAIAVK